MAFSEAVATNGNEAAKTRADAHDVGRTERCIAAARELANDTTSAAFTVAQVAARANVSLKSFYRCFQGKDELLLALLADDSKIGARELEQRVGAHADPEAALHAYVHELFAMVLLPGAVGYAGVLVREHRRLSEHSPAELRIALAPLVELLARLLARSAPSTDADRDAETMFRVILQGIDDVVVGRVDDALELAEYLFRFCWQGLSGATGRADLAAERGA